MKDEIKEILQMLEAMASNDDIAFLPRQASLLLDYITNLQTIEQQYSAILSENTELEYKITTLQEENKRLKEKVNNLEMFKYNIPNDKTKIIPTIIKSYKKEYEDYKSRNKKAIEYINKHLYMESSCGIQHPTFDGKPSYDFDCFELENILNGGDDNE